MHAILENIGHMILETDTHNAYRIDLLVPGRVPHFLPPPVRSHLRPLERDISVNIHDARTTNGHSIAPSVPALKYHALIVTARSLRWVLCGDIKRLRTFWEQASSTSSSTYTRALRGGFSYRSCRSLFVSYAEILRDWSMFFWGRRGTLPLHRACGAPKSLIALLNILRAAHTKTNRPGTRNGLTCTIQRRTTDNTRHHRV